MAKAPQPSRFLEGNYAPINSEDQFSASDLEIIGEIPRGLNGAFYRNGPNPPHRAPGMYHWFDGDGMVHGFFFEDGQVRYANRWIETAKLKKERQKGKGLYGGFLDLFAGNIPTWPMFSSMDDRNTANTHVWWHGGRLLCLWEAGSPTEIDPDTLATKGIQSFGGKLTDKMTAHPKIDPETGQLLFFGASDFRKKEAAVTYGEISPDGEMTKLVSVPVPEHTLMHDFATTRNYALFGIFPTTQSFQRMIKGKGIFAWEPELGTRFVLYDRRTGESRTFHDEQACFVYHVFNAHESEDGNLVHFDAVFYDGPRLVGAPDGSAPPVGHVRRWSLNLADGTVTKRQLDDRSCEFPRIDDRRNGLAYRYGYVLGRTAPRGEDQAFEADGLHRYDFETGEAQVWPMPDGAVPDEPVFVPKSPDSGETGGWLLAILYRPEMDRSELVILDAEDLAAGPVATIRTPRRIPYGFHANWRQAAA